MSTSKKVLLGVAAAAVVAIGYFAIKGYPPVGTGAEGTVGAAKKYQSEQISAQDVILQDAAVQQVLQSDAFRKVIADKETRAILASREFQKALSDANVQALLQSLASHRVRADAITLEKFGGDSLAELRRNVEGYVAALRARHAGA